jgi:hypothetical protein
MSNHLLRGLAQDQATGDALSRNQSSLSSLTAPATAFGMASQTFQSVAAATASGEPIVGGVANPVLGTGTQVSSMNGTVDVLAAGGALGNARVANQTQDARTTTSSTTLTCATCTLTQADVGKVLMVPASGIDGDVIGYGVASGTINRTTGAVTVTFAYTPSGNATAYYESASTWYSQSIPCTGAVCTGTLNFTPVVKQTLNLRTPDGADAFDAGPLTLITTVASVQSPTQLTMAAAAGATNDDRNSDGYVIIGSDDTAAINNAITTAISNGENCNAESLSLVGACNVNLVFDPGHSYLVTGPINITMPYLSNVIINGTGALIYSAQNGVLFNVMPPANTQSDARVELRDIHAFGALEQGSEGVKAQFAIWPRVTGSTWINFMLGIEVGSDAPSGSTSDMFNIVDNLLQYDGIGALFHACDDCGVTDSYVTNYHDRGIVVGDPLGSLGTALTHNFKADHVEAGGLYGSQQEGFDIGDNAENAAIVSSYVEAFATTNAGAVRLGQVMGGVHGIDIANTVVSVSYNGATSYLTVPAINTGTNFVSGLRVGGDTFINWSEGVYCSGATSNLLVEPNYFTGVTTNFSNCTGIQVQKDVLQNLAGANVGVPMTGAAFQPTQTVINGTAGTVTCGQGLDSYPKVAVCVLNGYQQSGAAQTWSFPASFSTTPVLSESTGSCGAYNPSATADVLTLPANAAMTAESCNVVAIGQ